MRKGKRPEKTPGNKILITPSRPCILLPQLFMYKALEKVIINK